MDTKPAVPADPEERQWEQLQRELKYWWGMLSEEDVLYVAGKRDQLLALLNEKYGYAHERATAELESALRGVKLPGVDDAH